MSFNFPNIISLVRVLISPVFYILIINEDSLSVIIACILFGIAASTDYLDGWYARKYKLVTKSGKFIDPLADKFLTTAAFIAFVVLGITPLWMVLIIIVRDIGTTLLRIYADTIEKPIVTSWPAKVKTFVQMTVISIVLAVMLLINLQPQFIDTQILISVLFSDYLYMVFLALTLLTLWTAIEYLVQNKEVLSGLLHHGAKKQVHEKKQKRA